MKNIKLKQLSVAALAAISFAACSTAGGNNTTNAAPVGNVAVADTSVSNGAPNQTNDNRMAIVADESLGDNPTECVKTYVRALKNNDAKGLKKTLSAKSLEMIAAAAKAHGKSLDEFLKMGDGTLLKDATEFQNEKIAGDAASVEAKSSRAPWIKIPLIKENAEWRVAVDKMLEDLDVPGEEGLTITNESLSETPDNVTVSHSKTKTSSGVNKTITISKTSDGSITRTETSEIER